MKEVITCVIFLFISLGLMAKSSTYQTDLSCSGFEKPIISCSDTNRYTFAKKITDLNISADILSKKNLPLDIRLDKKFFVLEHITDELIISASSFMQNSKNKVKANWSLTFDESLVSIDPKFSNQATDTIVFKVSIKSPVTLNEATIQIKATSDNGASAYERVYINEKKRCTPEQSNHMARMSLYGCDKMLQGEWCNFSVDIFNGCGEFYPKPFTVQWGTPAGSGMLWRTKTLDHRTISLQNLKCGAWKHGTFSATVGRLTESVNIECM